MSSQQALVFPLLTSLPSSSQLSLFPHSFSYQSLQKSFGVPRIQSVPPFNKNKPGINYKDQGRVGTGGLLWGRGTGNRTGQLPTTDDENPRRSRHKEERVVWVCGLRGLVHDSFAELLWICAEERSHVSVQATHFVTVRKQRGGKRRGRSITVSFKGVLCDLISFHFLEFPPLLSSITAEGQSSL